MYLPSLFVALELWSQFKTFALLNDKKNKLLHPSEESYLISNRLNSLSKPAGA